jgi:hypothetical protein
MRLLALFRRKGQLGLPTHPFYALAFKANTQSYLPRNNLCLRGNERPQAVSQRFHSRIWSINDCQRLALEPTPNKYIRAPWRSPPQRFLVPSCVQIRKNGLLHASKKKKKTPIPMDILANPCYDLGA